MIALTGFIPALGRSRGRNTEKPIGKTGPARGRVLRQASVSPLRLALASMFPSWFAGAPRYGLRADVNRWQSNAFCCVMRLLCSLCFFFPPARRIPPSSPVQTGGRASLPFALTAPIFTVQVLFPSPLRVYLGWTKWRAEYPALRC